MAKLASFTAGTHIAYFSMEIALRPEIHTYGGGLGVLAGDTARSCADLELPAVFVTLVNRLGYLRQEIDSLGRQVDHPDPWDPSAWAKPLGAKIAVEIEGAEVWVRPWLYALKDGLGYRIPVIFLDTDLDENAAADREITHYLYGGDETYRLKQEIVLGIGGMRALRALGFEIHTYHMNDGHSALLAVELLRHYARDPRVIREGEPRFNVARVRDRCVFTTHTPVEAGQDRFDYDLVERLLGDYMEIDVLKNLAGVEALNMARLALELSGYVNGVAKRHAETSGRMFPGHRVHAITNGVHAPTWACESMAALFDRHFPTWRHEPEILVRGDQLPGEAVWAAHQQAKRALIDKVAAVSGIAMEPEVPLLGFARRMTGYKRPDLLFSDLDRLRAVHRDLPFQLVMAGKAHPRDSHGKQIIEAIHAHMRRLSDVVRIAFLPNYDMDLARLLVSGADVWLNTPLPPLEASGTSGMKAALNGVLNLSTLDGWWLEACIEGQTGWAIGGDGEPGGREGDAEALYDKLHRTVLPLYHHDRTRWIWMMKEAIGKLAYYFNSQQMMRRYASEAYIR